MFTYNAPIRNLPELQEQCRNQGGSIVEYQRVLSLIYFSVSETKVVWMPPDQSRFLTGFKHAGYCVLLGLWSPIAIFFLPYALIKNLSGGIDVTKVLTSPPDQPIDEAVAAAYLRSKNRHGILAFLCYALVLGVILYF